MVRVKLGFIVVVVHRLIFFSLLDKAVAYTTEQDDSKNRDADVDPRACGVIITAVTIIVATLLLGLALGC